MSVRESVRVLSSSKKRPMNECTLMLFVFACKCKAEEAEWPQAAVRDAD